MQKTILVGVAGLIGTLLRYWLSGLVARQYGETFPWGTLVVNLVGCFLAGAVFHVTEERFLISPTLRTVILIGFLGGFTTFSSFMLDTLTLTSGGHTAVVRVMPDYLAVGSDEFVVVWEASAPAPFDIVGQRFDGSSSLAGLEFRVNTYTTSSQRHPSVAMDMNRDFVVVWESFGQFGPRSVFGQHTWARFGDEECLPRSGVLGAVIERLGGGIEILFRVNG